MAQTKPPPELETEAKARLRQEAEEHERKAQELRAALDDIDTPGLDALRLATFLDEAVRRMVARADGRERPVPLPWRNVTAALGGGLWPGLTVLVGNTGEGKTQFALQTSLHAAGLGVPTVYIGLELGRIDLVARLVGLRSERRWSSLYLGELRDGETAADRAALLETHAAGLADLPLYLEVGPPAGWDYHNLGPLARAVRLQHPPPAGQPVRPFLVVLDFLQLVAGPERELRERIGRAAYFGRAVSRDLDAAVLLLSSTSRENARRINEAATGGLTPATAATLVDLGKESGEVEYAADCGLVLVREEFDPEGSPYRVAVPKRRAGGPTWVEGGLTFDGGRFTEAGTRRDPEEGGPRGNF